jgi:hypothetical protein
MKKSIIGIGAVALFAFTAAAQEQPKMETYLGYAYVRSGSDTNTPSFNANGGTGQFAYNLNRWISGVADVGAVHNSSIGSFNLDSTFINYVFGPRISMRYSRFKPYFQTLFGGVTAVSSQRILVLPTVTSLTPISARISQSQNGFAMIIGGGVDVKISKHISFRPAEVSYYYTQLQNLRSQGDDSQNNLRYTGGINFTFGAQ